MKRLAILAGCLLFPALPLLAGPPAKTGHPHGQHGNPPDMAQYIKHQEDPSRDAWQKPDAVIAALGLKPGMVVCDVGAGPGYFSIKAAKALGPTGRVFAVDVEPRMLEVLRTRLQGAKLTNVTPVLAAYDNPLLPDATCDVVLVVDTYHHFENGPAYLGLLKKLLKTGGTLVNVDFHKRETPMGPPVEHRISKEDFLKAAQSAGLSMQREETFLPHQYMVVMAAG